MVVEGIDSRNSLLTDPAGPAEVELLACTAEARIGMRHSCDRKKIRAAVHESNIINSSAPDGLEYVEIDQAFTFAR